MEHHADRIHRVAPPVTANFQRELRNSELWDEMVAEFGEKRAEEMLSECKAEVNDLETFPAASPIISRCLSTAPRNIRLSK